MSNSSEQKAISSSSISPSLSLAFSLSTALQVERERDVLDQREEVVGLVMEGGGEGGWKNGVGAVCFCSAKKRGRGRREGERGSCS